MSRGRIENSFSGVGTVREKTGKANGGQLMEDLSF